MDLCINIIVAVMFMLTAAGTMQLSQPSVSTASKAEVAAHRQVADNEFPLPEDEKLLDWFRAKGGALAPEGAP